MLTLTPLLPAPLAALNAADPMNSSGGRKPQPERFQSKVFLNPFVGFRSNHA